VSRDKSWHFFNIKNRVKNAQLWNTDKCSDAQCYGAVPGWGLNRSNPRSLFETDTGCLFGVSAGRPHTGFNYFSTHLQALSLFTLVVLVNIAESNLILHAPQHSDLYQFVLWAFGKVVRAWQCFFPRAVTWLPRLGTTICRVLYFIVKSVYYLQKTVFYNKKRKCPSLGLFQTFAMTDKAASGGDISP
jgi:hypothetical protein